jgi:hypothetical protein
MSTKIPVASTTAQNRKSRPARRYTTHFWCMLALSPEQNKQEQQWPGIAEHSDTTAPTPGTILLPG